MRGSGGVSFRILGPDPLEFFPWSDLRASAEFPARSVAIHFQDSLRKDPKVRSIELHKPSTNSVSWTMNRKEAGSIGRSLKRLYPVLSSQIEDGLKGYIHKGSWMLPEKGNHQFRWSKRTLVMGVLNATPDSFSDGGLYLDPGRAVERALQMQEEGADWIDVGGESSRPGAGSVSAGEEKKRILPILKACSKVLRIPLSVDTYKAETAQAAVGEGARMVNDIEALKLDPRMGKTLARLKVPVLLMHMKGKPRTMQKDPRYGDVVGEILAFFRERIEYAEKQGIPKERLLLDPGFGFGKTPAHNIAITKRLWELKVLGRPLVMGPSRKSTLGFLLGGVPPEERVEATGAAVTASILRGADMVRVHDVKAMTRVVKIADAIRYGRGLPVSF